MSWTSFELPKIPSAINTGISGINKLSDIVIGVLTILKDLTETLAKLEISNLNATQLAIKTALDAVEKTIDSLLTNTGIYVLHVPPRKKIVIAPRIQAAMTKVGLSQLPQADIRKERLALFNEGNYANAEAGNSGFIRSVIESLLDDGDTNKPILEDTDYVVGLYILSGSNDYRALLGFNTQLDSVLSNSVLSARTLPVPQNLRVKTISRGKNLGAQLEWDFQPAISRLEKIDKTVSIDKVAVIRSTSLDLLGATSIKDIFGNNNISKGSSATHKNGTIDVIDIVTYSPTLSWIDAGPLETGKSYYYALSYSTSLGSIADIASNTAESVGFGRISNVVKLTNDNHSHRSSTGVPPDWIRTPTVIDLFPDLAYLLKLLQAQLKQYSSLTGGFSDSLKIYVEYIKDEIEKYETITQQLAMKINKLTNALGGSNSTGAYIRPFSGVGGMNYLLTDLKKAFTEDDAPPFTTGKEFVSGLVLLTVAPTSAELAPAKTLLNTLFGAGVNTEKSAIRAAIEQIDVLLDGEENIVTSREEDEQVKVGDDDTGEDLNCPPRPSVVEFDENFNPL
jgi:hypothetical protein